MSGVAGASARREHERLRARREARVRAAHPRLGGLILAVSDEPQSTTAWAVGARGEEVLAKRLDKLSARGVLMLHDRRIPGSRANIDHIAVTPAGVFVIDAKHYRGRRPHLRVEGGLFRARTERLMVGSRDCTKLVAGVDKQVAVVRGAFGECAGTVAVRGMLCFVDADWPLIGGGFSIGGVDVLWPAKAQEVLVAGGPLVEDEVRSLHHTLARALPMS